MTPAPGAAGGDVLAARLAGILRGALWLGVGLLLVGAALGLVQDGELPVDPPALGDVPGEVGALEPAGLLMLGLLVLLAGPVAGLVYLLVAFAGRRDRLYGPVVALLLAILGGSIVIALLTGGG